MAISDGTYEHHMCTNGEQQNACVCMCVCACACVCGCACVSICLFNH